MRGCHYITLLFKIVRFHKTYRFNPDSPSPDRKFRIYGDGCQKRNESAKIAFMLS